MMMHTRLGWWAGISVGLLGVASCSGGLPSAPADGGAPASEAASGDGGSDGATTYPGDAGAGGASGSGSSAASGSSAGSASSGASTSGSGSAGSGSAGSGNGDAASSSLTVTLVGAGISEYVNSSDGVIGCGPGPVTVPCSASYPSGTQVTLTASVGDMGFSFGGWSGGGCSGTGTCVVTVSSAQTVNALFHATLTYSDNANFIVPTGISSLSVQLWGGGGQGGYVGIFNGTLGCYTGTGGGGGGAYNAQSLAATAGSTYPITVGCGGCIISSDPNQLDLGGSTSFGSLLSAGGGQGGYDSPATGGPGGTCTGLGCVSGAAGDPGSSSSCNGAKGGSAGGPGGGGGGIYKSIGGDGSVPGGGGAGSEGIAGGMGAPGEAIISW